ncbi:MAG: hypothetical protein U9R58_03125 [Chloroflexota bacterium]|nr:hypothetical protein [Chloroflexota bacterium]
MPEDYLIKRLFDPYMGPLVGESYPYEHPKLITIRQVDLGMVYLYDQLGINLEDIASSKLSNPVTVENYWEWVENIDESDPNYFTIDALYARVYRYNYDHLPFKLFLMLLNIPHDIDKNLMNYESNYLDALMAEHESTLSKAKLLYSTIIDLGVFSDAAESFWDIIGLPSYSTSDG